MPESSPRSAVATSTPSVPNASFRPEARALPWRYLRKPQRDALVRIFELLHSGRADLRRREFKYYFFYIIRTPSTWLDPLRSSRAIFLDGDRGSGKSTVYCCLRNLLEGGNHVASASEELPKVIDDLFPKEPGRAQIHVLEPLDLEPLPPDTNLLTALVIRLGYLAERHLEPTDPDVADRGCGEATFIETRQTARAIQEIRRLSRDIAIAWGGSPPQRAGSVDLDMLGAETARVERARVRINANLARVLACLARTMSPRESHPEDLFVLPVDDFDLSPGRAVELMRLLRMVTTPRLVFLILGDLDLAEVVFTLKIGGELTAVDSKRERPEVFGRTGLGIDGHSEQLASAAMRKLIPAGQRIPLKSPTVVDALAYQPPGSVVDADWAPDLLALLTDLRVDVATAGQDGETGVIAGCTVVTLADLLRPETPVEPPVVYSGARVLEAPYRQLFDFWEHARRAVKDKEPTSRKLGAFLGDEARHAIDEDDRLPLKARRAFLDAFEEGADDTWELITDDLGTRARVASSLELDMNKTLNVVAPRHREWIVAPNAFPWDQPGPRAKASLILFHDVLQLDRETGVSGPGLAPDPWSLEWVYGLWDFGPDRQVRVPWPTPAWKSVWKYDILRSIWEPARQNVQRVMARGREGESLEYLSFVWMTACTSLLHREFLPNVILGPEWTTPKRPEASEGRKLAQALHTLWDEVAGRRPGVGESGRPNNPAREARIESWLVALACMLAPESGVLSEKTDESPAADALAKALEEVWTQSDVARQIRSHRARRLASFSHIDQPGYLRALSVTWVDKSLGGLFTWKDRRTIAALPSDIGEAKVPRTPMVESLTTRQKIDILRDALNTPFHADEFGRGAQFVPGKAESQFVITTIANRLRRGGDGEEVLKSEPGRLLSLAELWADHPINKAGDGILQPGSEEARTVGRELDRLRAQEDRRTRERNAREEGAGST